jgi:predicted lipase
MHLRNDIINIVKNNQNIIFGAHSRGGSVETIGAWEMKKMFPDKNITVVSEGSPRTGNQAFADSYNKILPDTYRIVNALDPVADEPPEKLNYVHVGSFFNVGNYSCIDKIFIPGRIKFHYPQLYLEAIKQSKLFDNLM